MGKEKKEVISFDIIIKLKRTIAISKDTVIRLKKFLNGKPISPYLELEVLKWMRNESGIKNFNDLIKESDLKEEDFIRKFMEFLEQMGLDIPRGTFSSNLEKRLIKKLDRAKI